MTEHAKRFLGPLTLEKLSGNRVVDSLFRDSSTAIEHIALARGSDLLLVAPATANTLAKFAHGIGDDFLSTLYISTVTPTVVAPAMNVEMWRHPATQANLEILCGRGVSVVEPEAGYLACGEVGEGRLAPPEVIVERVLGILRRGKGLEGKRVLVTAGPTVEDIDPVRFLSNRSSGKMGYAIAAEAQTRGARVTLVSGPTHLSPLPGVDLIAVRSDRGNGRRRRRPLRRVGDRHHGRRRGETSRRSTVIGRKSRKTRAVSARSSFDRFGTSSWSWERRNAPVSSWWALPPNPKSCVGTPSKNWRRKRLDLIVANDISHPRSRVRVGLQPGDAA